MPNLNPSQARAAWVEALRSGDYKQTTEALRDNKGHCCLGVACDVYLKTEGRGRWSHARFITSVDSSSSWLPYPIRDWLGLTDGGANLIEPMVDFHPDGLGEILNLLGVNDRTDRGFSGIADMIEQGKVKTNA